MTNHPKRWTKNDPKWVKMGPKWVKMTHFGTQYNYQTYVIIRKYDQKRDPKWVKCDMAQNRGRRVKMAKGIGDPGVWCACAQCANACAYVPACLLPRRDYEGISCRMHCSQCICICFGYDSKYWVWTPSRARVRTCFVRVSIHARALFSCARVKFVIMLRNIKLLPEIMCLLLCIACSRKWP